MRENKHSRKQSRLNRFQRLTSQSEDVTSDKKIIKTDYEKRKQARLRN